MRNPFAPVCTGEPVTAGEVVAAIVVRAVAVAVAYLAFAWVMSPEPLSALWWHHAIGLVVLEAIALCDAISALPRAIAYSRDLRHSARTQGYWLRRASRQSRHERVQRRNIRRRIHAPGWPVHDLDEVE